MEKEIEFLKLAERQLFLEDGRVVQNCSALTDTDWKKFESGCQRVRELRKYEILSHSEFLDLMPAVVQEMWQLSSHIGPKTTAFMTDHELLRGMYWFSS